MITATVYPGGKLLRQPHRDVAFFAAFVFFSAYLFLLIKLLFLQLDFHWSVIDVHIHRNGSARKLLAMTNLVPFYKILYYARGREAYSVGLINVVGNIAMFVPMGLALPYFFTGLRKAKHLAAAAALISLSAEMMQLITATGVFDIDDVVLNTAGALVGCWLFGKMQKLLLSKASTGTQPMLNRSAFRLWADYNGFSKSAA